MKIVFLYLILCSAVILPQDFSFDVAEYEKKSYENHIINEETFYPGDPSIDILFYKLNLNITWRPDYLKGEVLVRAKNLTEDLSAIFLDLTDELMVDSVIAEGHQTTFTHENDKLFIDFNPILSGEILNVLIYYQGIPGSDGSGSFTFGEHNGMPAIFNLSEPYGAKDWWPCKDTPADKADSSEVWLTVRDDLTAVSNGTLEEVIENGDTKTYKWKNHYPIAHYLISAAISNYSEYRQNFYYPPNIIMPVVHYIYPEHLEMVKPDLDRTLEMLNIFSELFDIYPFLNEKYGHAEFGWGGGMEHQTISSMGAFNENIISHELAHQWFGDKITCRDWHHIWLNEGFATFATSLYYEKSYGDEAYKSYIEIQMANAKNAAGSLYVQDITSFAEIFSGPRSYSKGAVVLHMLRGITGDSVFFNILKTYADDPSVSYGTAVTEDFRAIAERIYGGSLEYFFNEWVYGVKYPKYLAGWNYSSIEGNIYRINLHIGQQLNDTPLFFTMPLQIKISTGLGDTTAVVFNNQQIQDFEIIITGKPIDLIVDPENYVLKEILYTNTGNEYLPKEYSLEQNYPNPFNSSTMIKFSIPVNNFGNTHVKLKLFDVGGNEINVLYDNILPAGAYTIPFNAAGAAKGISSGAYIYTLEADGKIFSRKMMFLK